MKKIIELGSEVKDTVTGFRGVVTARAIHLNGCDRYWVQPPVKKVGEYPEGTWIDVSTLKVTKAAKPKQKDEEEAEKPGGFSSKIR